MADQEELKVLQKTYNDLQDYYNLLRQIRNDIEKMISNFSCAPDNKINEECKRNNIRPDQCYEYNIFGNRMVDVNVCIIGGGLSAVYTAVLLKQSRLIKDIHLVDLNGKLSGAILDANHIDTSIRIKYFTKKLIRKALVDTNVIALMDESDFNIDNDPYVQLNNCSKYVHQMVEHMITICPTALVAIFTKPVTATLSMVSEIYKRAGKWDPNRLIGSVSTEIMRIETITGNILDLNPASLTIPIAGGADLNTIGQINTLIELFQATEQDKMNFKVKKLALLDGSAAVKLILTLVGGLNDLDNVYACAFVRSNALPVCRFFTSQLQFGMGGIKKNFGLPKVSSLERKKTTIEILEELDLKIKEIQEYGQNTEQRHKKIIGAFVIYSVALYITTAFIFYFYFFPASLYDQLFYITPLLIFPILILLTKKMVSWYYKQKISHNQEKLVIMQREKTKILDEVTETETYKKAKEILLRFAPDQLKMTSAPVKLLPQTVEKLRQPNVSQVTVSSSPGMGELRRRTIGNSNQFLNVSSGTNDQTLPVDGTPIKNTPINNTPIQTGPRMLHRSSMGNKSPEYTLARPVLPHHRSIFDRLIDYLVGDGPSNRYALICRQCEHHNGMALKEEFEYLGFRCCYCNFWNPPKKQKPGIQKVEDLSNISPTSATPMVELSNKTIEPSKISETDTLCLSDTDSDIEVVETPTEISENQNQVDSNSNEGIQSSQKNQFNTNPFAEDMEVDD
ncbi:hypothetical protein M0802_011211 [Mischocyttarus mexicanus]|nr:hypothetical protein M0802_011211 [Mischocyttarus mexicanus]